MSSRGRAPAKARAKKAPSVPPKQAPSPPKAVETTRERIREVALDVFAEHGFEGTSTREICSRAGVNGAALNYHWRSKQQLWEAVCERCGDWFGSVAAQIDLSSHPRDAIASFLRKVFDGLVKDPRPIRVVGWAALLPHEEDREGVAQHFRPFVGFAQAYMRAQQSAGAIPTSLDIDALVLLIHNMLTYTLLNARGMRSAMGGDLSDPALALRFRETIVTVALGLLGLSEGPEKARRRPSRP